MKKIVVLFFATAFGGNVLFAQQDHNGFSTQQSSAVTFKENKGQVSDQNNKGRPDILFSGTDGALVYHLKNNGISYQLSRVDSWKEMDDPRKADKLAQTKVPDQTTIYRLDVNWINANTKATIGKGQTEQGVDNYYTAVCPNGVIGVKSYQNIVYENLYHGIDLKWYSKDNHLKYDYIVAAGADYKQIQLQFEGAESLSLNEQGDLVIATPLGEIIEQAPLVIQQGKILPSKWVIKNNIVSFAIEHIDAHKEFSIDPIIRSWATYCGGTAFENGTFCTTDFASNVYLAGYTLSTTTIATVGAHQQVCGGSSDSYLVKFNSNGIRQWGTYYGGANIDYGVTCTTDAAGDVYLAGYTQSMTAIASVGAHQTVHAGGLYDGFLAKFNPSGVLQWGTYCGGEIEDYVFCCATDFLGNIYITGTTTSTTGIATVGSHQPVFGGINDLFLVKFNSAGVRQWGTYYGGALSDQATSCATDFMGNVYLSGTAASSTGIATIGSHQTTLLGNSDGILAKFNSGGVCLWGTYYGGTNDEWGAFCAIDTSGNIYLVGQTNSTNAMATVGVHQTVLAGMSDAFLVQFNTNGVRQWGTYYGGTGSEYTTCCAINSTGDLFITGYTSSTSSIASAGAYQTTHAGGTNDAFFGIFNTSGVRQWGTYYGGTATDRGLSCAADISGSFYLAGYTESTGAIASVSAHQTVFGGIADGFLVKFVNCSTTTISLVTQTNVSCYGASTGAATVVANGGSSYSYFWAPSGGNAATATGLSAGTYTCTVANQCGTAASLVITITQPPQLIISPASQTNVSCNSGSNGSASINTPTGGTGGYTYNWTPGNPTGDGTLAVSGLTSGTWTCTVTDANSCTTSQTFNITQPTALVASVLSQTNIACFGGSTGAASVAVTGGTSAYTYNWTPGNPTGDGTAAVTGLTAGTWTCTVTDANSCTTSQTFNITQPAALVASVLSQTNIACFGGSTGAASVAVTGGTSAYTYNWTPGNPIGDGTAAVSGLSAGTWICTVTDANSCTTSQTFNITEPTALVASVLSQTNISCFDVSMGAASVAVTGGTTAYTYNWTPGNPIGDGTASVTGLTAGTWTCTVTDANSCTTSQTFNITQPTALVASASATSIVCYGDTATVLVTGTGGTLPYTGTGTFAVTAGIYSYTVTDANGCISSTTITLTEPSVISTAIASTNVSCFGHADGSLDLTITGGVLPYTFDWNNGTYTTEDIAGLPAGIYTGVVTDANGCSHTETVTITEPTALSASITTSSNPTTCSGTNGAIDITVTGATSPYTFVWSNAATTEDITAIGAGLYTCTISDANGCITSTSTTLNDPNAPIVTLALPIDSACQATTSPFQLAGASPLGGTFSGPGVTANQFDPMAANIGINVISYMYTDTNGCTGTALDFIYVDICLSVNESIAMDQFTIIPNPNNGTFTLQVNTTEMADVMIYDAIGQLVSATKVQPTMQQQISIESVGVYLVTVVTADGNRSSQRVVVSK